jgi:ATP-dependent protease ClpP protease subunit
MKRGTLEAKLEVHKRRRVAVISISGTIGLPYGFHAPHFLESLASLGEYDVLYATLDSFGGSPVDASTIFDFLKKSSPKRYGSLVLITGECSGDALLIALGFDQILMRSEALMGFHPATFRSSSATRYTTVLMARLIAQRAPC